MAWSRQGVLSDSSTPIGVRSDDLDPSLDYQFLACSGAVTNSVRVGGTGQYGEVSQIDKGYLDENTTLVTMSIGGNDARFADIVKKCLMWPNCQTKSLSGDDEPMNVAVPKDIFSGTRDRVTNVLREIHTKAPNAQIVLMGYPEPFPTPTDAQLTALANEETTVPEVVPGETIPSLPIRWNFANDICILGPGEDVLIDTLFNVNEGFFANAVSRNLNAMFGEVAEELRTDEGISVTFSDPTNDFTGHDLCATKPGVHSVVFQKTDPEPMFILDDGMPVSQQSFHPNLLGAQLYAQSLNDTLRETGM
jgi:hypothetical protein